jgi:hypothetical protein
MLSTEHAAIPPLLIVLSLVASCGAKSELPQPISSCPEPASAVPDPGSLMLGQGEYETAQVTLHNQCAETIWPAWTRTGGFDATVLDPSLWAPLSPGEMPRRAGLLQQISGNWLLGSDPMQLRRAGPRHV